MNNLVIFAAFCLAAVQAGLVSHGAVAVDQWAPAHYKFDYGVADAHTGDKKSQTEVREGDVVKGSYSLLEADGTTRVVEYTADPHNGFNAVVKRIGHAAHPQVLQKKIITPVVSHVAAPIVSHAPVVSTLVAGHGGWSGLGGLGLGRINGGWGGINGGVVGVNGGWGGLNGGWSGVNGGWNGANRGWGGVNSGWSGINGIRAGW